MLDRDSFMRAYLEAHESLNKGAFAAGLVADDDNRRCIERLVKILRRYNGTGRGGGGENEVRNNPTAPGRGRTWAKLCRRLYASYSCSRSWRFLKKLPFLSSFCDSSAARGFSRLLFGLGNAAVNAHAASSNGTVIHANVLI